MKVPTGPHFWLLTYIPIDSICIDSKYLIVCMNVYITHYTQYDSIYVTAVIKLFIRWVEKKRDEKMI